MKKSLLSESCLKSLNQGVEFELGHFYLYKVLANKMQQSGYHGAQAYFLKESNEELEHYQKHVDFINDMGGLAKLPTLAPESFSGELDDAMKDAYDNEYDLLKFYKKLWKSEAMENPEIAEHINFYLKTQVEHVGFYGDLIALMEDEKDNPNICMVVDDKLAKLAK